MPSALVLGARNLGGAIADRLLAEDWRVAVVARSEETLDRARDRGALAIGADATSHSELGRALAEAAAAGGGIDLVVNAVSAARPTGGGPFGGGPLADAEPDAFDGWATAVAAQAFAFLSTGARFLRAQGRGGTLIQVTGGSARRAIPGRGLWSAGAAATRAMTHAAAQELREEGIHVALLVVDATIASPKTAAFTADAPPDGLADQALIADAVLYLAGQQPRAFSHELTLTPAGDRWVP